MGAEKAFAIHDRIFQQTRYRREFLQPDKGHPQNAYSQHLIYLWKNTEHAFYLYINTGTLNSQLCHYGKQKCRKCKHKVSISSLIKSLKRDSIRFYNLLICPLHPFPFLNLYKGKVNMQGNNHSFPLIISKAKAV